MRVTYSDIERSSTLELSDLGCECTVENGCINVNTTDIAYVPDDFIIERVHAPMWYHKQGLMQTATGYGSKLVTEYKVKCADNKTRRVYCSCFSNIGSTYILVKNMKKYLDL